MRFLASEPPLFRGLRERHIRAIDAQNAAAVHGPLETAQGAIDGFAVSNLDSYRQNYSPCDTGYTSERAARMMDRLRGLDQPFFR